MTDENEKGYVGITNCCGPMGSVPVTSLSLTHCYPWLYTAADTQNNSGTILRATLKVQSNPHFGPFTKVTSYKNKNTEGLVLAGASVLLCQQSSALLSL